MDVQNRRSQPRSPRWPPSDESSQSAPSRPARLSPGPLVSKYFYHYSFDLPSITTATANYLMAQPQNKRWATIAEDTGFGEGGAALMSPIVVAHGGEIVKSVVIPQQNTETDFSNALGDIRNSNPDVVAVFDDAAKGDAGIAVLTKAGLKATITTALLYLSDVDPGQGRVRGSCGRCAVVLEPESRGPRHGPTGLRLLITGFGLRPPRRPTTLQRCNG